MNKMVIFTLCLGSILFGCAGTRPSNLGVREGRLSPCPDTPNCVSSQSTDPAHAIAPFVYTSSTNEAFSDLTQIIGSMKRASFAEKSPTYLRAEFRSRLFGFVDDVEFVADEKAKVIHVRSASRIGYSDFGVNRKRLEEVRRLWEKRKDSSISPNPHQ